ncbi:MAG TPA: flavodoxin family protein [Planctomycetota bacterium]|nr:flavodoxin family protein [Planctomycetota bacterium]
MADDVRRRAFLGFVGGAVAAGAAQALAAEAPAPAKGVKIVGVACSPRKGKTTAAAVQAVLDAAKAASPAIEVELIELADMNINGAVAAGVPLPAGQEDDFLKLAPKLSDPKVGGIIVGSPVYFGSMSSLCKAFLDRWVVFRKANFPLSGKVAGVVAVGGNRNGGQELTIQCIQAALMCHEMLIVGDGRPTAHRGATLWNNKDDISGDELGLGTAKNLGRRVAEVALKMAGIAG